MGTTEDNKALVRRFYQEINDVNLDAMDDLVAEDYLDHGPPPFPGLAGGREGLKQAFRIHGRHELGLMVQLGVVEMPQDPTGSAQPQA